MARGAIGVADFNYNSVVIDDELNSITLTFDVPPADITSFADTYQNVVAGKPSAKIDVAGTWDPAASQGDATIFGELGAAAKAWIFEPDASQAYNGFAIVTSYSITASVTDAVKYTASFQHNGTAAAIDGGAVTRA